MVLLEQQSKVITFQSSSPLVTNQRSRWSLQTGAGGVCIVLNVLLPSLGFVLRLVLVDVPREWSQWQLHRSQQLELRQLQRHLDTLMGRKHVVGTPRFISVDLFDLVLVQEALESKRVGRTSSSMKRKQHLGEQSAEEVTVEWLEPRHVPSAEVDNSIEIGRAHV